MNTILITGINGFLGSNLALKLKPDYNIVGLANSLNNLYRLPENPFKVYSSEVDKKVIFQENEIYAVIHAATVYRRNDDPIDRVIKTNVLLPAELYNLANKYGTKLFLNTDSFFNNPKFDYKYLVDYTLSKKQAIEWLRVMQDRCHVINMKIYHMYGKNDAPDKFIPKLLSDIRNNTPIINLTPGEQRRDFVYVEDIVSAYKIVLQKSDALKPGFIEFQLGTGTSSSIKELALSMREVTNSRTELKFGVLPYRENEIMNSVSDNRDLIELGWEPKFDLKNGLMDLLR